MQYDVIIIDMFNLFYRKKNTSLEKDPISIARNMVTFIDKDIKSHLCKDGKLILLYDPIPKTDLGLSRIFRYTERQQIVSSYKSNRKHDRECLTVVNLVRKYYLHRGPDVISVISDKYEADDYVESIIKEYKNKDIVMISTDEDWCKYLSDKVVMMNNNWVSLFTVNKFKEKYNFIPSISGVCVWKACFGDGSDNIRGALQVKGLKRANNVKLAAFEYVKYLGNNDVSVEHIENLSKSNHTALFKKENKTPEENFIYQINMFDPKYEVTTTFFQNLKVIKSRCNDYKPFATSKEVDDKFNIVIEKTLGFNTKKDRSFKFGMIKG